MILNEEKRRTTLGNEIHTFMSHKKAIPAELIVRMLKRIIYSGDGRKKFILSGFPMVPEIMQQI